MSKKRIYYIEDEYNLGRIVTDTLVKMGYDVKWEQDGKRVMESIGHYNPEICILDIMLPGIDGYSLCRMIKGVFPALPVIFLTAKTGTDDLVEGFEAGGTDYVKKPFSIEELVARVENQLSLAGTRPAEPKGTDPVSFGKCRLDPSRHILITPGGEIKLSNRDMQVLRVLVANRGGITDRKQLLLSVWGDDSIFNSRNLDVYIRKIRRYLSSDPGIELKTLKGRGYLFIC